MPEGTYPILLSQKTQEKFECVAEWDLSALEPHIIVPIEKIREDLKDEESDFNNLKWKIEVCLMIIFSVYIKFTYFKPIFDALFHLILLIHLLYRNASKRRF